MDLPETEDEWRERLTPEQYHILRARETEPPGTGKHLHETRDGIFRCAGCGTPVFLSEDKYDAGCGWPSFTKPLRGAVRGRIDLSHSMIRREVSCATCGGHLGHVFPDGPLPRLTRYCINSSALTFMSGQGTRSNASL